MEAFMALRKAGKIRHFGVSNLDLDDMRALWRVPGGKEVAANQLLYNLTRRGIEWDLLPWLREHGVPLMAYSPIEQATLLRNPRLARFAEKHGISPVQAVLAWLLAQQSVIAIPKTSHRERLRENHGALALQLCAQQLAELDAAFPPPDGPRPLAML